jgi:hypothetical protein
MRNSYKILDGKGEEKKTIRRRRRRWEENIKIGLKGAECKVVDWIQLSHYRIQLWALVHTVMNFRVP